MQGPCAQPLPFSSRTASVSDGCQQRVQLRLAFTIPPAAPGGHFRRLAQSTGVSHEHGDARLQRKRRRVAARPVGLVRERDATRINCITTRRILYWLAAAVAVLVVGTVIGLIWADTSDAAGLVAVVTNIVGAGGIV